MIARIVLFGAGGHGRGTLEILLARREAGLDACEVIGFVDDDPSTHGTTVGGVPVRGGTAWLDAHLAPDLGVILAIASARAKQAIASRLATLGAHFATAVHPSAILGRGTTVGVGAIVGAGVVVAYDTRIGAHTTINLGATIGHDCVIGDFATVAPGVNITGNVTLGLGVEVQTNATLVPGITLGDWSRVGPGSVVLRDVEADGFVFGNPARRMPRILERPT